MHLICGIGAERHVLAREPRTPGVRGQDDRHSTVNRRDRAERRRPVEMDVAFDSQSLMVNWPNKVQRRTVEMTSCCGVGSASWFILELDVNHDPRFDPFDVNHESAEHGDMTRRA